VISLRNRQQFSIGFSVNGAFFVVSEPFLMGGFLVMVTSIMSEPQEIPAKTSRWMSLARL